MPLCGNAVRVAGVAHEEDVVHVPRVVGVDDERAYLRGLVHARVVGRDPGLEEDACLEPALRLERGERREVVVPRLRGDDEVLILERRVERAAGRGLAADERVRAVGAVVVHEVEHARRGLVVPADAAPRGVHHALVVHGRDLDRHVRIPDEGAVGRTELDGVESDGGDAVTAEEPEERLVVQAARERRPPRGGVVRRDRLDGAGEAERILRLAGLDQEPRAEHDRFAGDDLRAESARARRQQEARRGHREHGLSGSTEGPRAVHGHRVIAVHELHDGLREVVRHGHDTRRRGPCEQHTAGNQNGREHRPLDDRAHADPPLLGRKPARANRRSV